MEDEAFAVQTVKLKVHYTFDAEHKNDHLTKPPQSFSVRTAPVDENLTIGIVELRTCLEAVINSSPEIASNLENDFTVYAYDYSESNTPLVGQGMLSKILLQDGSLEADNEAMVTGRITKNGLGVFSKNAQPNLEVKLRFTPMLVPLQRARSGSVASLPGEILSTLHNGPQAQNSFSLQRPHSPMSNSGLENMQRMLSEGGPSRERRGSSSQDSFQRASFSRPSSRSGTPGGNQTLASSQRQILQQSRPSSRSGFGSVPYARRESVNSGYCSEDENQEDGPARKRARITKVSHPMKSSFNIERQPDSLRVAASAASSVRLHRPTPLNAVAALQQMSPNDDIGRPPTPVPRGTGRPRGRPRKKPPSNLDQMQNGEQQLAMSSRSESRLTESFSSPEGTRDAMNNDSVNSTPIDLPSSPPMMPERPGFVTSPILPALTSGHDSGFMSANMEDMFVAGDDFAFAQFFNEKGEHYDLDQQANPKDQTENSKVRDSEEDTAGEPTAPRHTPMLPPSNPQPYPPPQVSEPNTTLLSKDVPKPTRSAPTLLPRPQQAPELHRAQTVLPNVPASDPVGMSLQRSNTWAPDMSDAFMSDTTGPNEEGRGRSRKRVGKEQTKARLENAIASGEMPPFCDNCGAIETPAWRRGFIKYFDCPWEEVETSLEPGACCYKEPVALNPDGSVKLFKGYKVEKSASDKSEDWIQISLCNPCGLWFHKSKCPRPWEKWQKKDPKKGRKRKRPPKGPKQRTNPPRAAAGNLPSEGQTPASEDSSPGDESAGSGEGDDNADNATIVDGDEVADSGEPQLPPMLSRSFSAGPHNRNHRNNDMAGVVLRQAKSSPIGHGSVTAPIDLDLTPRPLRRVLFPSPTDTSEQRSGVKPLSEVTNGTLLPSFVRRSPRLNKIRDIFAESSAAIATVGGEGKENFEHHEFHDDGLADLFGDDELPIPSTPTPKRRSERLLSRTPKGTPSKMDRHEGMDRLRTPKAITHPLTSILLDTVQRNLNPCEMTPFTRSIHDVLAEGPLAPRTPRSSNKRSLQPTPRRRELNLGDPAVVAMLEFPDLPSLKNSSPISPGPLAFNFSELSTDKITTDFDDIFSTEAPMPSSPPPGFFDFLNSQHQTEHDKLGLWHETAWHHIAEDNENDKIDDGDVVHAKKGKEIAIMVTEMSSPGTVRRSPRKHRHASS